MNKETYLDLYDELANSIIYDKSDDVLYTEEFIDQIDSMNEDILLYENEEEDILIKIRAEFNDARALINLEAFVQELMGSQLAPMLFRQYKIAYNIGTYKFLEINRLIQSNINKLIEYLFNELLQKIKDKFDIYDYIYIYHASDPFFVFQTDFAQDSMFVLPSLIPIENTFGSNHFIRPDSVHSNLWSYNYYCLLNACPYYGKNSMAATYQTQYMTMEFTGNNHLGVVWFICGAKSHRLSMGLFLLIVLMDLAPFSTCIRRIVIQLFSHSTFPDTDDSKKRLESMTQIHPTKEVITHFLTYIRPKWWDFCSFLPIPRSSNKFDRNIDLVCHLFSSISLSFTIKRFFQYYLFHVLIPSHDFNNSLIFYNRLVYSQESVIGTLKSIEVFRLFLIDNFLITHDVSTNEIAKIASILDVKRIVSYLRNHSSRYYYI